MKTREIAGLKDMLPVTVKKVQKLLWMLFKIITNLLLSHSCPTQQKKARVVLIPKEHRDALKITSTYRTICVLNEMYEMPIRERLVAELYENNAISERQFGFCKVTEAVMKCENIWCAFITLQVKNTFNTTRLSIIINNFKKVGKDRYQAQLCGTTYV